MSGYTHILMYRLVGRCDRCGQWHINAGYGTNWRGVECSRCGAPMRILPGGKPWRR